ncbi:MAG TPA: formylglycine-generating enzyme family protein [Chitinophagales bacterium]|nr:formylglycine-generating enzyme family protein [Chitinophagales bacterium]
MFSFRKTVVCYSTLLLCNFISCNSNHSNQSRTGNEQSLISGTLTRDSILGVKYLNKKYLDAIEKINVNPQKSEDTKGMLHIKGGTFRMGGDRPAGFENMPSTALAQADEFPKHEVRVSDFLMDEHEVTVGEFLEFVKATGYKTVAEQDIDWEELKKQVPAGTPKPKDSLLKAGALVFHLVRRNENPDNLDDWWTYTPGANWKNPDGKQDKLKEILRYPVTQVSWYDAMAYAKWVGKRLPTEAEFEYALRSGKQNNMYPWGNEKLNDKKYYGNFLQGDFPYTNTVKDGYALTAPVKSFPPNAYGLYDIVGNVWEWTNDWYGADYYKVLADRGEPVQNPLGPEKTYEVNDPYAVSKVIRGGSFLCSDGWCSGYRNSRRMRLSPDSGMQHVGFRCVRDIDLSSGYKK